MSSQIRFWRRAAAANMPTIYADTSALFAYFHPDDEFSAAVDAAVLNYSPDFWYWSFLKFELRHNLRQTNVDARGAAAWRALRAGEKSQARLRWQSLDADKVIQDADILSQRHATGNDAGAADWLHVAAAKSLSFLLAVDEFWTCDKQQAAAARLEGLETRLFTP